MNNKMSATKESEHVDHDLKRVQMFKERNVYGHATDSSVQRLLYDGRFTTNQELPEENGQSGIVVLFTELLCSVISWGLKCF